MAASGEYAGTCADPGKISSLHELVPQLDILRCEAGHRRGKRKLSLQDLTELIAKHYPGGVPRTTLHNYVSGRTIAPPAVFEAILRSLDVESADLRAWSDAWDRIDDTNRAARRETDKPVSGRETPDQRKRPGRARAGIVIAAAAAAVAAIVIVTVNSLSSSQEPQSAPTSQPRPGECVWELRIPPVVMRDGPSFDSQVVHTMTNADEKVIGACEVTHGKAGTTCGAPTVPVDRWVRVRMPRVSWVFEPCLTKAP
jgi:hypothetical protein